MVEDELEYEEIPGIEWQDIPKTKKPSIEASISHSVSNFGRATSIGFVHAHNEPLKQEGQIWNTGMEILDSAIRSLKSGVILVGGVENCGKSNFTNSLEMGVLDNTNDVLAIDIILDDDQETRMHQLAAARGRLPMDLMTVPSLMEREDKRREERTKAYSTLSKDYRGRLEIVDSAFWNDQGARIENIVQYLRSLREAYPTKKIWVTLDAFDDVVLPKGIGREEKVQYVSETLKALCNELGNNAPFVIVAIKQYNKQNRGRYTTGDSFGGSGRLIYDAKVALQLYTEMGELGNAAGIYFHPDPKDLMKKEPILEVFIQKNKRGGLKGKRIYFYQFSASYWCSECPKKDQELFDSMVVDAAGAKKGY